MGISIGVSTSCSIMLDGDLYCWGLNAEIISSEMLVQTEFAYPMRTTVLDPLNARVPILVDLGSDHACALLDVGSEKCRHTAGGKHHVSGL